MVLNNFHHITNSDRRHNDLNKSQPYDTVHRRMRVRTSDPGGKFKARSSRSNEVRMESVTSASLAHSASTFFVIDSRSDSFAVIDFRMPYMKSAKSASSRLRGT